MDRYLVRTFLAPFLVATFALVGVFTVAEVLTHIGRFVRHGEGIRQTAKTIVLIYALRAPTFVAFITPMTLVVGAAYGMTRLSKHNELTAMKACGISLLRVLTPIFVTAAVIAMLAGALRELVVPFAEQRAARIFWRAVGDEERFQQVLGVVQDAESVITEIPDPATKEPSAPWRIRGQNPLFRGTYSFVLRRLRGVRIVFCTEDGGFVHIEAKRVSHRGPGEWLLEDVTVGGKRKIGRAFWHTALRPKDLSLQLVPLDVRALAEIVRFIRAYPANPQYRVRLYSRLVYPVTGVILLMLGLPPVLNSERLLTSNLLGMGAAVVICLAYFGVQFLSYHLGENAQLPPAVAVLAPTILGLGAGGYLLDTVQS